MALQGGGLLASLADERKRLDAPRWPYDNACWLLDNVCWPFDNVQIFDAEETALSARPQGGERDALPAPRSSPPRTEPPA